MTSLTSGRTLRLVILLGGVALAGFMLAGCKGIPAKGEKQARGQMQIVAAGYRPHGQKPALPELTADSGLSNYLTYAMLNQPAVEAAYYDWLASVERITTARSLPDPQITFQMDIENIVSSVMPGFMMNFPGPGKLRLGGQIASAESQARYFTFQSSILESAFDVKRSYYQLHFLEEKLRVNRETLKLLSDLETLARSQNEVGKVTLQDVLRAQIEQDRLKTELANLEDSRTALLAQFQAALGLRSDQPGPPVPTLFESTPLDLPSDKLLGTALAQSTRLKAIEAEIRAAEAAIALAYKARVPDTSLGLMADLKTSPVLYRPIGAISLPVWRDKIAAQIAEAQAVKQVAQARLSEEQIALALSVAEKSFTFREVSRNLALLNQQLLPKARKSLEVARNGYLSGQIDFFNLTDSERTLLSIELDAVEAATQRELVLAELSLIVQGMPPTASMGASPKMNGRSPSSMSKPAGSGRNNMR